MNHVGHALFVERLPEALQPAADSQASGPPRSARRQKPTAELVRSGRPAARRRRLPRCCARSGTKAALRDAVVLALAKHPQPEDRAKFVEALASPQPAVVERAAQALAALGNRAARRQKWPPRCGPSNRPARSASKLEPRTSLMRLLEFWTEDGADVEWDPDPAQALGRLVRAVRATTTRPKHARLKASSGADRGRWQRRLAAVDWTRRRRDCAVGSVFELRSCHRCHQQSGHLGPELKGAVTRMSRDDLFTAILDPNLEVSPAYLTTLVATDDGQVYHGLVVYESPESTLLQTGPDTTVRITSTETDVDAAE